MHISIVWRIRAEENRGLWAFVSAEWLEGPFREV